MKVTKDNSVLCLPLVKYLRGLHSAEHEFLLATVMEIQPPILFGMDLAVLVCNDPLGFITSDEPCVWFNPELYSLTHSTGAPVLVSVP